MSRIIDNLLSEYGESHQNSTNKTIHWICVPLIFFSMVGLIYSIPNTWLKSILGTSIWINWATIVLALVFFYYLKLSKTLALGMLFFGIACLAVCHFLSRAMTAPLWATSLVIFVLAWIGQFYGHKVEGKKPSFLKDIRFLLIGPAWLMHFIYKKWNIKY